MAPVLSIAPRPDTAQQWQARQQIITEMRNEVDTFGLLEAGDLEDEPEDDQEDEQEDEETSDDDWDY